jgi:hypothetical protein
LEKEHEMTSKPSPNDSAESLYQQASRLYEQLEEQKAIMARIKAYIGLWKTDKRMKILGRILLDEFQRIENEEGEKTQQEGRGA